MLKSFLPRLTERTRTFEEDPMSEKHLSESFADTPPENYQRFFVPVIGRPLAEDLLRKAALQPGERVLDVGCGTGVVTRLAAEAVGSEGRVAGLDSNPGMLAVAGSTSADHDIEWRHADAGSIPYRDGTFDVVLCQLSLQLMQDRPQALREMQRVLRPGGRLLLSVPGPAGPVFRALADAMEHHISQAAAGFVNAVFSLHDEPQIQDMLAEAGLDQVEVRAFTTDMSLPEAHDFLWQYIRSTPLTGLVGAASDSARAAMEDEVLGRWSGYATDGGLLCTQRIVVGSGRKRG